jgi:hypothetical protein
MVGGNCAVAAIVDASSAADAKAAARKAFIALSFK